MVKQKLLMMCMVLAFVSAWGMKKTRLIDDELRLYDSQDTVKNEICELFAKITLAENVGQMMLRCHKEKPFDINIQHPNTHNTLLHCFVRNQLFNATLVWKTLDVEGFRIFFEKNADPNITNKKGCSVLHRALKADLCSEPLIKILLENKADPNQEHQGQSPLCVLLYKEHFRNITETVFVAKLLLESKADPNWQKKYNGERIFDVVMGKPYLNFLLVESFIKNGVNPCRYYDYENLSYGRIEPNTSYGHRVAYLIYLRAIPGWMLQKNKAALETFLLSLKFLKKKFHTLPLPPKRLLEHFIFNYILPGYEEIKREIKEVDQKNWVISVKDQQDIDKKVKGFISLYS